MFRGTFLSVGLHSQPPKNKGLGVRQRADNGRQIGLDGMELGGGRACKKESRGGGVGVRRDGVPRRHAFHAVLLEKPGTHERETSSRFFGMSSLLRSRISKRAKEMEKHQKRAEHHLWPAAVPLTSFSLRPALFSTRLASKATIFQKKNLRVVPRLRLPSFFWLRRFIKRPSVLCASSSHGIACVLRWAARFGHSLRRSSRTGAELRLHPGSGRSLFSYRRMCCSRLSHVRIH